MKNEVEESIQNFESFLSEDPIYNSINKLFENKISEHYSKDKLEEIYKEGAIRYDKKTPPGYEDAKVKDSNKKFGDLILWKQIMDLAKEKNKPILLITDERKTDWWWKLKDGRNMGPKQELIEEIKSFANVDFHMYSSERFLSFGNQFLQEIVNEKAVEEIKQFKKFDLNTRNKMKFQNEINHSFDSSISDRKNLKTEIDSLEREISNLETYLTVFDEKPNHLNSSLSGYLIDKTKKLNKRRKLKLMLEELLTYEDKINLNNKYNSTTLFDFNSKDSNSNVVNNNKN